VIWCCGGFITLATPPATGGVGTGRSTPFAVSIIASTPSRQHKDCVQRLVERAFFADVLEHRARSCVVYEISSLPWFFL
jgi:hypothetical protein